MNKLLTIFLAIVAALFIWRFIKKQNTPDARDEHFSQAQKMQDLGSITNNNTIDAIPPLWDYLNVNNDGVLANVAYAMFNGTGDVNKPMVS